MSEFITRQSREETIAKLQTAGYSKRQGQKLYDSYRRRFILIHDHAEGKHKFWAKCTHWVPPVARQSAGQRPVIQPTKPTDRASDWVAIV